LELVHLQAYQWLQSQEDMNTMGHVGIEKKSTRTRSRNSFFYIYFQKFYWMAGVPKREKFGRLSRRKSVNIASAIARTICSTCQTQANNEPRHTCRYPKFFVVVFFGCLFYRTFGAQSKLFLV
jgi:hypothetical protein